MGNTQAGLDRIKASLNESNPQKPREPAPVEFVNPAAEAIRQQRHQQLLDQGMQTYKHSTGNNALDRITNGLETDKQRFEREKQEAVQEAVQKARAKWQRELEQ